MKSSPHSKSFVTHSGRSAAMRNVDERAVLNLGNCFVLSGGTLDFGDAEIIFEYDEPSRASGTSICFVM